MLIKHYNPLVFRALQTAVTTRTAKKNKKKKGQPVKAAGAATKDKKSTKGYPRNTLGVNGDVQPIGILVPGVNGSPEFRIWDKKRVNTGDPRWQISKKMRQKMLKAANDPGTTFSVPGWASGKAGINTTAKSIASANHGGGAWGGGPHRVRHIHPRHVFPQLFFVLSNSSSKNFFKAKIHLFWLAKMFLNGQNTSLLPSFCHLF